MDTEVVADVLGKKWKGYVVWVSGGNNKQGFSIMHGIDPWQKVPAVE